MNQVQNCLLVVALRFQKSAYRTRVGDFVPVAIYAYAIMLGRGLCDSNAAVFNIVAALKTLIHSVLESRFMRIITRVISVVMMPINCELRVFYANPRAPNHLDDVLARHN